MEISNDGSTGNYFVTITTDDSTGSGTYTWPYYESWNYCPGCGKALENEWKYCPVCGKQLFRVHYYPYYPYYPQPWYIQPYYYPDDGSRWTCSTSCNVSGQ